MCDVGCGVRVVRRAVVPGRARLRPDLRARQAAYCAAAGLSEASSQAYAGIAPWCAANAPEAA
ncbi:MAG: hypothetical protein HQ592_12420 [Planctomycetes bacterium]|nr:hypothetical protein [Planctomycetota bacterium]